MDTTQSNSSDPVQALRRLLDQMRASYQVYQDSHWTVGGDDYYGNHLLLERIYGETEKQIDKLAEMMVGSYGPEIIQKHKDGTTKWADSFRDPSNPMRGALRAAKKVRESIDSTYESLDAANQLGRGWDDLLMSLAQEKDEHLYLLQQATNTPAKYAEESEDVARIYGSHKSPVPGDAGDVALYRGRADGIEGIHKNPYSPNDFQHGIYEQGFEEGFGGHPSELGIWEGYSGWGPPPEGWVPHWESDGRSYSGPRGGGGRGGGGRGGGGGGGGGGGRGRGGGGRRGGGRGRRGGRGPGGGPGMGRGRGRRRRHRRHGINIYPYFTLPYYYGHDYPIYEPIYLEPVIFPRIRHVTARRESVETFYPEIEGANGVIGMVGSGFEGIPGGRLRIIFTIGTSKPREKDAAIIEQSPTTMSIAIPVDGDLLDKFQLLDIAYYRDDGELVSLGDQFFSAAPHPFSPFNNMNHGKRFSAVRPGNPRLVYQTGYGAHAVAHSPTIPGGLPPSRMTETTRMALHSRMLPEGARFGVPGIPFPQPGWAGQAGVAQSPHPTRRMAAPADRTFGPGLSAGQGGVQTFRGGGGGRMGAQTYGSLGYASMGDGSMDMAVRGQGQGRGYAGWKPWDCAENCWKMSDVLHPGDFGAYQDCLDTCKDKWGSFSVSPSSSGQQPALRSRRRRKRRRPRRRRRRR